MPKDKPEYIRLMSADGTQMLDSVATEYEDSFCLETFGDLVRAAEESEPKGSKKFIIARVQTWDHKQPDRAFYSYYHAHHLNKILFQTQIYLDKKLIHRLHVLNPLTNTDIIGNVLYFIVVGRSKKVNGQFRRISASPETNLLDPTKDQQLVPPIPPSPSVSKGFPFSDPILLNRALHNTPADNEPIAEEEEEEQQDQVIGSVKDESSKEAIANRGWTLMMPKTALDGIAEPSLLQPSPATQKRASIVEVAQSVGRKMSMVARTGQGFKNLPNSDEEAQMSADGTESRKGTKQRGLRVTTNFTKGDTPNSASVFETQPKIQMSSPAAYPLSALPVSNRGVGGDGLLSPMTPSSKRRALIPSGAITRNGERITPIQALSVVPRSARSRRRSLSFMNAVTTAGAHGATIDEWSDLLREDRAAPPHDKAVVELETAAGKYDEVKPFGQQLKSPIVQNDEEFYYDAVLIATDNDFLETSRVRTIFRENAVNPTDSQLFEMPPFTGENSPPRLPHYNEDVAMPCDACFPTDEQLRGRSRFVRILCDLKCYMLVVIVTAALVTFIVLTINRNGADPTNSTNK